MSFIKTTNIVIDKEIRSIRRTVQCPYCKTFLQGISQGVFAMECWNCKKEFRIQKDKNKFLPRKVGIVKKTILGKL